jgi:transposase-like protein
MKMMWYIMSQKYGANAIGLSRVLGVALTTTWNILHKLRRAMVRAEREKLGPVVEVDESFFGGLEEGTPGRGAKKKVLIVGAVELSANNKRVGRIRLSIIPDASSSSLIAFIKKNVEPGSTVVTDGWSGYHPLKGEKFTHIVDAIKPGQEMLPNVHRVFSLFKRLILGTFQGAASSKYIAYYLDEYVFRFNRRKSSNRGKLFRRLMEQAVITAPITRMDIRDGA